MLIFFHFSFQRLPSWIWIRQNIWIRRILIFNTILSLWYYCPVDVRLGRIMPFSIASKEMMSHWSHIINTLISLFFLSIIFTVVCVSNRDAPDIWPDHPALSIIGLPSIISDMPSRISGRRPDIRKEGHPPRDQEHLATVLH